MHNIKRRSTKIRLNYKKTILAKEVAREALSFSQDSKAGGTRLV